MKSWLRIGSGVVAIPILACLWCFRPFVRFRILIVAVHRFGHLALEPELWLANKCIASSTCRPKMVDLWNFDSRQSWSNGELAVLWKTQLRLLPSWCIGALVRAGNWLPSLAIEQPTLSIYGPCNALDRAPRQISRLPAFSKQELRAFLGHGIDLTRPYVSLVVRDSTYYLQRGEIEKRSTSILNGNLDKFVPACLELVSLGYQVIRLGGPSWQRLPELPGCFDYANSQIRTSRLDVSLPSNCTFAIATQTGPDAVALLARRPVLYIDVVRFSQFFFGTSLATWAPMKFSVDGNEYPLSAKALSQTKWLSAKDPDAFVDSRLTLLRATSDEVCRYVVDYASDLSDHSLHLENATDRTQLEQWQTTTSDILRSGMGIWGQKRFGDIAAPISKQWLRENHHWWLAE